MSPAAPAALEPDGCADVAGLLAAGALEVLAALVAGVPDAFELELLLFPLLHAARTVTAARPAIPTFTTALIGFLSNRMNPLSFFASSAVA
jgi:hypothetical protein